MNKKLEKQVEQKQDGGFTVTLIAKSPTETMIGQPIAMDGGTVTMAMLQNALRIAHDFLLRQEGYQIALTEQERAEGKTE